MKTFIEKRPLLFLLLLAFLVRLVAVIFAKGYMMHDDHFLTIEPSASWADGYNFNDWMPTPENHREHPEPISFFYLGFLFVFFKLFNALGLDNPDTQMFLMRLIHAVYSLLTVYFAYKITERLSGKKDAFLVGLLLAVMAFVPNFSVRNLVEFVSQPPLLAGFYILIKNNAFRSVTWRLPFGNSSLTLNDVFDNHLSISFGKLMLAALILGLAVGFRYQTVLIVALVGVMFVLQREWSRFVVFGAVAFTGFFITQLDDVLLWGGQPFQHLLGYFGYNAKNAFNYPGAPLTYVSFIGYYILPPVSLFLLTGFGREWRRMFFIVLPIGFFILFHIVYPNRQERFIMPALPFFVIAGVIGWNRFRATSAFWLKRDKLHKILWAFFWSINIMALLVFSTTYSKRSRVEAMLYLANQGDCRNFIQEFTYSEGGTLVPQFYANNWSWYYVFRKGTDIPADFNNMESVEQSTKGTITPRLIPNYILFYNDEDIDQRIQYIQEFADLEYMTTVEPGWFDQLLHRLNDKNSLEKIRIYRMKKR